MNWHFIASAICFAVSAVFAAIPFFLESKIVTQVNSRLPPDEHVDMFALTFNEMGRSAREYQRLFPNGRLVLRQTCSRVISALFGVLAVWQFLTGR